MKPCWRCKKAHRWNEPCWPSSESACSGVDARENKQIEQSKPDPKELMELVISLRTKLQTLLPFLGGLQSDVSPGSGDGDAKPVLCECFSPWSYIAEEMAARKLTKAEVAKAMGDESENECILDFIRVESKSLPLGDVTASRLAKAFGTSKQLWLMLDVQWRNCTKQSN